MLVNIAHDTKAEHRRLLYAGVAFMLVLAILIAFSIAIYQKVFTPVTMVTVTEGGTTGAERVPRVTIRE